MTINSLLRGALESHGPSDPDTLDADIIAVAKDVAIIADSPTPQEIIEDVAEAESTVSAINMIDERLNDIPENADESTITTAVESANFAWDVLRCSMGVGSDSTSLEAYGVTGAFDRTLSAAVESIAKDARKLAEKFDGSAKQVAESRRLLSRVRREVSSAVEEIDGGNVSINLEGILSFLSRDFEPVGDVLKALKEEESNLDDIIDVANALQKEIGKVASDMGKLPVEDGMSKAVGLIDDIPYNKIYDKIVGKNLLFSSSIKIADNHSISVPSLDIEYNYIEDGTGAGGKGWLKTSARALVSGILNAVVAAVITPGVALVTGAASVGTVYMMHQLDKRERQGANTNTITGSKDLLEILDVVDRILGKGVAYERQLSDVKASINRMYTNAKSLDERTKDKSDWTQVAKSGIAVAGAVGMALATNGRTTLPMNTSSESTALEVVNAKIFECEMAHTVIVDILYTHISMVGLGTLRLSSGILKAVGRDNVK